MAKGGQEQKRPQKQTEETPEVEASADVQEKGAELKDELDDLLDEIDEVLEANAEEFVRGFIQKGGE